MGIKICVICGKVFDDHWHNKQKFCSRACWNEYDRLNRPPNPLDLICENCGKPFQKFPGAARIKAKHHFCSRECDGQWRTKGGNPIGENHPEYNSIKVHCSYCGRGLIRQPYRLRNYQFQFCDSKCFGAWRSHNIHSEKHPRWRGGRLPDYGPEWLRIAEAIRQRDGYQCRNCGISQADYGKKLSVHHIIPFRSFGYKRGENENHILAHASENLITLCDPCHMRIEAGHLPLPA